MRDLQRPLAVAAVAGGLVVAGYATSADRILALAAAALASVMAGLGLAWQGRAPVISLGALLVLAVFLPVQLAPGLHAPFALATLLFGAWLLRGLVVRRQLRLRSSGLVIATLAFIAISVLAFLVGQYPWFPTAPAPMRAQVGGLALFVVSGGVLLVAGHELTSSRQLERLTWLFVALGAAFVLTQVIPLGELGPIVSGVTRDQKVGSMFWVWLVAISLGQALFNTALRRSTRVVLVLVVGLAIGRGVGLAIDWASGWLPPLIGACLILLVRFPRTTTGAGLLLLAPAILAAGPAIGLLMGGEWYSWMTRLEALQVMGQIIQRNPWLGFGPANYYHYTILYPILGWWVRFNSHNQYVDLVAQTGLIGLVAFAWIVFEAARVALVLAGRRDRPFTRAYGIGVLGGLAASVAAAALGDWVVPFAYNVGMEGFRSSLLFWFFLGGLLVLRRPEPQATAPAVSQGRPATNDWAVAGDAWPSSGSVWTAALDPAGPLADPRRPGTGAQRVTE
jgi:hypothetical protein